ncbi:MAG: hypothetical protein MUC49_13040 [Raineya sp.]|jgi:hypothetical protein|nr:hypothetical protein [Raineya sp.]
MNNIPFTFQMPLEVKNALIGLSAKRKQSQQSNSSMKEIILEMIQKGLQAEEAEKEKKFSLSD